MTSSEPQDFDAEERKAVRHMVRLQLPPHLKGASLDGFDPTPDRRALELVRRWVEAIAAWSAKGKPGGGPSVMLTSSRDGEVVAPGNGKSLLAAGALLALADAGVGRVYPFENGGDTWVSLMWISSADLIAHVRSTYNRNTSRTAEEVIAKFVWADVLVLDDIGTESGSEDATAHLFRLIDARIGKPTFYTSNYSTEQLRTRSPEWAKVESRMRTNLRGAVLRGPDRRRPAEGTDPWGEWK